MDTSTIRAILGVSVVLYTLLVTIIILNIYDSSNRMKV